MQSKHEVDLTKGPIFKKLIKFAIPLILTNMLQLLFNATDVAVLGIFAGDDAVGAVGANTSLINLLINLFVGIGAGASVVLSKYVGQGEKEKANKLVGTAILISVIIGVFLSFVGFFGAKTFLTWMNCDEKIIDGAALYLKIYFLGMPVIMLYNFAAGLLRAVGDTFRPMLFLILAGIVNVGLNVFFVTVCNMTVEGVAIATVIAQAISAILALIVMLKGDGYSRLYINKLKLYKEEFVEIIKVGLPSGIQASMFSISNVLIQSTVNTFGAVATTANTVAQQFDAFVALMGNSLALANMSFVSQNYGALKPDRIVKAIKQSCLIVCTAVLGFGLIMLSVAEPLCRIMTDDPEVLKLALVRMTILCTTFFLGNLMDVLTYALRGVGKSTTAMIISIFFVCVFRIIWLNTFYLLNPTFEMIYISYPISWSLSMIVDLLVLIPVIKKIKIMASEKDKQTQIEAIQ